MHDPFLLTPPLRGTLFTHLLPCAHLLRTQHIHRRDHSLMYGHNCFSGVVSNTCTQLEHRHRQSQSKFNTVPRFCGHFNKRETKKSHSTTFSSAISSAVSGNVRARSNTWHTVRRRSTRKSCAPLVFLILHTFLPSLGTYGSSVSRLHP